MLSILRKLLLVSVVITLGWTYKSEAGQFSMRFLQIVSFAVDYPYGSDSPFVDSDSPSPSAISETPSSAQSGCFEGGCHASLKASQKQFVHTPFEEDQCLDCHTANHADPEFTPERSLELCLSCHSPESLGYTHDYGVGVVDPRNGDMLTCLSCHEHHSAEYRDVLTLNGTGALCVSCHTELISQSAQ